MAELRDPNTARGRPVSSLAPSARLLCLLFFTSGLFRASVANGLAVLGLALALLWFERRKTQSSRAEIPGLAFLCAFTFIISGLRLDGGLRFDPAGIQSAALWCLRLLGAYCLGRLFYLATPSSELREAAGSLMRRVPGRVGEDCALALTLVLGFVPKLLFEWRLALEAGRSRGLHARSSPGMRLRIVEAFLRRGMLEALQLPEILLARGWTGHSRLPRRRWRLRDWIAGCASLFYCLLTFAGVI